MALRTLVFSTDHQAAQVLARHLAEFDLEAIMCSSIFQALESAGRIRVDGVIVDWNDDPEASFFVKRLREIDLNRKALVIAIVKDESEVARAYDAGAKAVLFRPLDGGEIREALTKARPFMLERAAAGGPQPPIASVPSAPPPPPDPLAPSDDVMPIASPMAQVFAGSQRPEIPVLDAPPLAAEAPAAEPRKRIRISWGLVAALAVLAAVPLLVRYRSLLRPAQAALHNAVAAVMGRAEPAPAPPPPDDSFDTSGVSHSPSGNVRVVTSVGVIYDEVAKLPLRHEVLPDFVLYVEKPNIPPPPVVRTSIPDSIKRSAPIEAGHPIEVHPTPVMLDVAEPISIPEDAARQLVLHSVDPAYPQEAVQSGIQGAVVVQAIIGRDGNVRELHLIDGYFVLGRAALQAVKKWRFRPYIVNGRAVETETVLTFNFRLPVITGASQGSGNR